MERQSHETRSVGIVIKGVSDSRSVLNNKTGNVRGNSNIYNGVQDRYGIRTSKFDLQKLVIGLRNQKVHNY